MATDYIFKSISCDQAALWTVLSVFVTVCLTVRMSVCDFFHNVCCHHIIMKVSEVIAIEKKKSKQNIKVRCQRSKSQRLWNEIYCCLEHERGVVWFFDVIRQISRWHGPTNRRFRPQLISVGSCYGLAPNSLQNISWTNSDAYISHKWPVS